MSTTDSRRPESRTGRETPQLSTSNEPTVTNGKTGIEPKSRVREALSDLAAESAADKAPRKDVGDGKRREYSRPTARASQKEADA